MIRHDDPVHQQLLEMAYDAVDPKDRQLLLARIAQLPADDRGERSVEVKVVPLENRTQRRSEDDLLFFGGHGGRRGHRFRGAS